MKYCLFYGSLKRDKFNFNRFGGQTYLKDLELNGWEMYDLTYYPAICISEDLNNKVQFELHSVEDESFEYIKRMENGAGYKELIFQDGKNSCSIFYTDKEQLKNYPRIQSGVWD